MNRLRRRARARKLVPPRTSEERYVQELRGVLAAYHRAAEREIEPLLSAWVRKADERADANEITGKLDLILTALEPSLRRHVVAAFERMIESVKHVNAKALADLGISVSDLRLGAALEHARDENIRLVENAARVYARQVRQIFDDPEAITLRVEVLKERLLERAQVSESRAELVARDQVLKTNSAINRIRQENAGVSSYVWSTSLDERVRETHDVLEGKVFAWSAPPEPGHPGEDYQCRCVPVPVIPGLD